MINLIPPAGQRALKREYMLRVGATYGFLFGWVFVLVAVALVPTYVLIRAQVHSLVVATEQTGKQFEGQEEAEQEVRTTQQVLTQLKAPTYTASPSMIIEEIMKFSTEAVVFNNVTLSDKNNVLERVHVQGVASTREALAQLKVRIEASDLFETAEVPIADLARDVDVPFAITITPTAGKI